MTNCNLPNRLRAFADVVSLDGWTLSDCENGERFTVHADIVFGTARLGGEAESKVRFRLSVKQAELVVIIPETEPAEIIKSSVARTAPDSRGQMTVTEKSDQSVEGKVAAKVEIKSGMPDISAAASANGAIGKQKTTESTITNELLPIQIVQSRDGEGNNRWRFVATTSEMLDNRPWDAQSHSLLKVIDKRQDKTKGIPPSVRLVIRCLREDLEISEPELKLQETSGWKWNKSEKKNNELAAIALIRNKLEEENLSFGELEDGFASIELATAEITIGE